MSMRLLAAMGFVSAISLAGTLARAEVPYSAASVERGRAIFMQNCTQCHGNDGKSQVDVIADATDLTEPELYRNGTTVADMTRSIRDGAKGTMPPWGPVLNSEESIGDLVNFLRSLWPADQRPAAAP